MQNAKKLMAFVLALAMLLPCFTAVSFNAAAADTEFTDAASANDWVLVQQGFKATQKADYQAALAYLATDTTTYAEAHARVTNALASLDAGADYYDDFAVFGHYVSDLDDQLTATGESGTLQPGEYFYASTNTTNYNYIFGGAYAQRLSETTYYATPLYTQPTKVDLEELFVPTFHFGHWAYSTVSANNKMYSDNASGGQYTALQNTFGLDNGEDISAKFNKLALNSTKTGADCAGSLEAFTVTANPLAIPVIFYNYIDTNNWNAVTLNDRGFHYINCVNGTLNKVVFGSGWGDWDTYNSMGKPSTNIFNEGAPSSWLFDSDPLEFSFVWSANDRCYIMTATDPRTDTVIIDKKVMNSLGGLTAQKMPTLIISDLKNTCLSNNDFKNANIGLKTVSVQYSHSFTKQDVTTAQKKYEANCANPAEYYTQCADCGLSSKGYTDETFFDPSGTLGNCVYEDMYDAFVHWQGCPGCGRIDSANPKEPHDATCGHEVTAESVALSALKLQGFHGVALEGYQTGLALLEANKDSTAPINEMTNATWKEAYDRLSNAIGHLNGVYDYYDDMKVFGSYISDMDDRELQPGDLFNATNTSNYDIVFGGAYAQRKASENGWTTLSGATPYQLNLTQLIIPNYHFAEWNYSTLSANNKDFTDYSQDTYSARFLTDALDESERITDKFNKVILNSTKIGAGENDVLDRFSVVLNTSATGNGTAGTMIFYNYIDSKNWSAIADGSRGFYSYNCVDGKLSGGSSTLNATNSIFHSYSDRNVFGYGTGDSNYTYTNGFQVLNNWDILGNVEFTFVWNSTEKCYTLTVKHLDTGVTLATKDLNSTLSGHQTNAKMKNVMVSKITVDTSTIANITGNTKNKIVSIATKFVDASAEPHVCTPTGDWISDGSGNHYKNCSCGQKVDSTVTSCTIPDDFTTANGVHTKACADCGYAAAQGDCADNKSELIHDGTNHWKECTVCGVEIAGTKQACATTGGYQWENNQHWATYACGAALPKANCSGTEYVTADGQHQLKCATCGHVYGDETQCSGTELVNDGTNGHYTKCATCGVKIDSTEAQHNQDVPATYTANAFCSCGYEHENTKKVYDFLPQILGAKILKASKADDQKLRVDIDFSDMDELGLNNVAEYGVIVAPLTNDLLTDPSNGDSLDVAKLKALYATRKVVSNAQKKGDERIMNLIVSVPATQYGKRIALIAYIKDTDGNMYYSENNVAGVTGLTNGAYCTGVMRVIKGLLSDTNAETGYNNKIGVAASAFRLNTTDLTASGLNTETYTTAASVADLVKDYLKPEFTTTDARYNDAKSAAKYIYYYAANLDLSSYQ